eukprot:1945605-Prymnesium_polylepis.1
MDAQQRAEAMEAAAKAQQLEKVKYAAEVDQEMAAQASELGALLEIQKKLEEKLANSDRERIAKEQAMRAEMEERIAAERREVEEKAAQMEVAVRLAEQQEAEREAERKRSEAELREEVHKKEETLRKEEVPDWEFSSQAGQSAGPSSSLPSR